MVGYKLSKNDWVTPFFVIFRSVREKSLVTVSFDHPVVLVGCKDWTKKNIVGQWKERILKRKQFFLGTFNFLIRPAPSSFWTQLFAPLLSSAFWEIANIIIGRQGKLIWTSINETLFFEEMVVLKFIFVEQDIVEIVGLLVIGGFV